MQPYVTGSNIWCVMYFGYRQRSWLAIALKAPRTRRTSLYSSSCGTVSVSITFAGYSAATWTSCRTQFRINQIDVSPISWIFPADTVLEEADFVSRSSPITIVSDAVNSLMAAPVPHHYGILDLANSLDPESRNLPNGERWFFHVNKFLPRPTIRQSPPNAVTRCGSGSRRLTIRTSSGTRRSYARSSNASCMPCPMSRRS